MKENNNNLINEKTETETRNTISCFKTFYIALCGLFCIPYAETLETETETEIEKPEVLEIETQSETPIEGFVFIN